MNCDDYREILVSQICGELEREQEDNLNAHLESCTDCKQQQIELRSLAGLVQQLPDHEWDDRLRIKDLLRRSQRWRTIVFSKAAVWVIAVTALIGVVSYLPLRWELNSHEFSLHWGNDSSSHADIAAQLKQLNLQLASIQKQDHVWQQGAETRIKQMMDQNNAEQQKHYWQTLQMFSSYLQYQRNADLQKIQHDITSTYDRTGHEVEKTNELLEYVLKASSPADNGNYANH